MRPPFKRVDPVRSPRLVLAAVALLLVASLGVYLQCEILVLESPRDTATKPVPRIAALRLASVVKASDASTPVVSPTLAPTPPPPSSPPNQLPPPPTPQRPPLKRFRKEYECVGWRATRDCSPDGAREPVDDAGCDVSMPGGRAGFCLYRHRLTGETTRLFQMHCDSLSPHVLFDCAFASQLVDYSAQALLYTHGEPSALDTTRHNARAENQGAVDLSGVSFERGITMVVFAEILPCAYASIRLLRELGTTLPIEVWYKQVEVSTDDPLLVDLVENCGVLLREILDPFATDYYTKLYAVFYSAFDSVLLLDADNFAVKDPTYLFETQAFLTHGAVFWPDFWHPDCTIFNVRRHSVLWQVLDLPFADMFEQESGQVLIDRRRHRRALHVLMYYGFALPRVHEELVWGDKDLFRLAWMKANSSFFMVPTPPASAGTLQRSTNRFCGLTMVQHDPDGVIVFLHRNLVKLRGDRLHQRIWTHVLEIKPGTPRAKYVIQWSKLFQDVESCWGRTEPVETLEDFTLTPIHAFPFRYVESRLLEILDEAGEIIYHGRKRMENELMK
jgi:alpha 1,2-mannosyltransferase